MPVNNDGMRDFMVNGNRWIYLFIYLHSLDHPLQSFDYYKGDDVASRLIVGLTAFSLGNYKI